jgi:beta-glucosidase
MWPVKDAWLNIPDKGWTLGQDHCRRRREEADEEFISPDRLLTSAATTVYEICGLGRTRLRVLGLALVLAAAPVQAQFEYPFQDPSLPAEQRIDNLVSLLTLEEKVGLLSSRPGVPRLGIAAMPHVEGLHGLAMGGPSNWGRRNPAPTTIFPQAIGLAETWDTELLRQVGAAEGYEVRYMYQSAEYHRGGLVVRAPNADLGRDPRWGRTEECYGEDPFFNGTMAAAFIQGLQGDDPKYWLTASLLKHFFANSNEDGREGSSSDFDEALFRDY